LLVNQHIIKYVATFGEPKHTQMLYFNTSSNNRPMKARFFYAPPIFNTNPKLYVLTSDGDLFTEYRKEGILVKEIHHTEYQGFRESSFTSEDYPLLLELKKEEAIAMPLHNQANWIENYLSSKNAQPEVLLSVA
jgi:hypothetical protein